jgi:hypothetical protein
MPQQGKVDISNLYPGLDPSQMDQARENLEAFLGIVFRISEDRPRTFRLSRSLNL